MREIKFRAWDKDLARWVIHSSQVRMEVNNPRIYHLHENGMFVQCEDIVLMQYTGLRDKNDVEIYEGDICRIDHLDKRYLPSTGVIEWDEREAGWSVAVGVASEVNWSHEVIGNIYENPELLEQSDARS